VDRRADQGRNQGHTGANLPRKLEHRGMPAMTSTDTAVLETDLPTAFEMLATLLTRAAVIPAIPYLLVSIRSRRAAPTRRAGEAAGRRNARPRWRHASG
jgi:hypothetical protein